MLTNKKFGRRLTLQMIQPSPFIAAIKRSNLILKIKNRDPLTDMDAYLVEQILKTCPTNDT